MSEIGGPTWGKDNPILKITFEVIEAIYAIDFLKEKSEISTQASMVNFIKIEFVEVAVPDKTNIETTIQVDENKDKKKDEVIVLEKIPETPEIVVFEDDGDIFGSSNSSKPIIAIKDEIITFDDYNDEFLDEISD